MILGDRHLEQDRVLIAELGNNHEGDPALARELVDAAAQAGADAVKVQVINPARLVNCSQRERIAQLTRFRLPLSLIAELAQRAAAQGMFFVASAFDEESLEGVAPLVAAVKIASGDLDFKPLLIKAAALGKPLILSTGMATLAEVDRAVNTIARQLKSPRTLEDSLALLHCVSLYPVPLKLANLKAIQTLKETFSVTVGYSDHCLGIECAVAALALGARIIEKHFTLDKSRTTFRDHALSADPRDLRRLAEITHAFDEILGSGEKLPGEAEVAMSLAARRCIVAARDLKAGEPLSWADLDYVRPREGLPPEAAARLVGRTLRVPVKLHQPLIENLFNPDEEA
ncbi:MAG: N-acetylneuraminate synthase family protein [Desulfobaccales bacterium]|nr:N-acetylneuraminate synthase family protein [Desulfobaccales bacterium]